MVQGCPRGLTKTGISPVELPAFMNGLIVAARNAGSTTCILYYPPARAHFRVPLSSL